MSATDPQRHGRSIRLFLVDGVPTGLMIAEIVNWSGKAIVVPRSALRDFLARAEAKATSVYLLAGPDPGDPYRLIVYVGEADDVGVRLRQHDANEKMDFFERAVVFVSKDENLTKAHARWLEARLVQQVRAAGRAKDMNGNEPGGASLPEADRSDMNYFLAQIELVLPVLGLDILRPAPATKGGGEATERQSPVFMFAGDGYSAEAQEIEGEFVVKAEALVRARETATIPNGTRQHRLSMREDGVLTAADDGMNWKLTRDLAFASPSAAASFVYGGSSNGRLAWKLAGSRQTYGEWRENQLKDASADEE